ncbi:MAG TPA: hypothetical protein VGG23_04045 [Acidimicrobiales bacterium]
MIYSKERDTVSASDPASESPFRPGDDRVGDTEQPGDLDWDALVAHLDDQPREAGWVTLEEASGAAGVARSTLRAWYRSGQVPARMVAGVHGPQRLVPLDAVVERALRSPRIRRQLDHARSLETQVEALERRLAAVEALLGVDPG